MREWARKLCFMVSWGSLWPLHCAEYLVKWKSQSGGNYQKSFLGGARVLEHLSPSSLLSKIEVSDTESSEILSKLREQNNVEYVVRNRKISISQKREKINKSQPGTPKPPTEQWALEKINATAAWSLAGSQASHPVTLAVVDSGVDYTHEALAGNMLPGYDFKDNDEDPMDETGFLNAGHGTHCAGIAGANGFVAGSSPTVSIMPLRVLGKNLSGNLDDAIQAIDYAVANGAHVISASWGGEMTPEEARPLVEAVQRAKDAGVFFVTSAGNGDEQGVGYDIDEANYYPAVIDFENTLTVTASDEWEQPAIFSNFGIKRVHIAAPGMNILSTLPRNRYDTLSGTSMSAPLVAGVVAYLKAIDPTLSNKDIKNILLGSGAEVDIQSACNCRVDALAAVKAVLDRAF